MAPALIYRHAPVAMKTQEKILLGGAKGNTEKFGPLKAVLERIPGLFAGRTVRLQSPAWSGPLTESSGNRFRGE